MNICYECKWCKKDFRTDLIGRLTNDFSKCAHPRSVKTDPVTGHPHMHYCSTERGALDTESSCTSAGFWFEKAEPQENYGVTIVEALP